MRLAAVTRKRLGQSGTFYEGLGVFDLLKWWCRNTLERAAWPDYECEDCIGMAQHGCYCSYYGASAPGVGPERKHVILRRIHGMFWPKDLRHTH